MRFHSDLLWSSFDICSVLMYTLSRNIALYEALATLVLRWTSTAVSLKVRTRNYESSEDEKKKASKKHFAYQTPGYRDALSRDNESEEDEDEETLA